MPSSPRFRPFDDNLDADRALAILRSATDGADDGELFLERRRGEALVFDDGRLRNASYDAAEGFGLRAVRGEATGYAHATEISEASLRRAAETARNQASPQEPPMLSNLENHNAGLRELRRQIAEGRDHRRRQCCQFDARTVLDRPDDVSLHPAR